MHDFFLPILIKIFLSYFSKIVSLNKKVIKVAPFSFFIQNS